jgi:AraC-like DNA-binding protein
MLNLSEYVLRDFAVERVDAMRIELGSGTGVRFPAAPQKAYFHLVLSGTARLRLDEQSAPVELATGHFALLLYGAAHGVFQGARRGSGIVHTVDRWETVDEPRVLALGTKASDLRVLSGRLELARVVRSAPSRRALPHLLQLPAPLFTDLAPVEAACRGPGAAAFVFALAQMHLAQVLREVHHDFEQLMSVRLGAPEMGRIAGVVRRMREHPEKRWTVAGLAREVGCSRSSFAAKFHDYAGMGPIAFAARTRLTHAQAMLRSNPELPMWEVAKRVGYDVQGSFTRAFKEQFGVSPRRYAQNLRGKDSRNGATGELMRPPESRREGVR